MHHKTIQNLQQHFDRFICRSLILGTELRQITEDLKRTNLAKEIKPAKKSGFVKTFVPPVKAVSHSPALSEVMATLRAAKLEEHAVSTEKLGPLHLK